MRNSPSPRATNEFIMRNSPSPRATNNSSWRKKTDKPAFVIAFVLLCGNGSNGWMLSTQCESPSLRRCARHSPGRSHGRTFPTDMPPGPPCMKRRRHPCLRITSPRTSALTICQYAANSKSESLSLSPPLPASSVVIVRVGSPQWDDTSQNASCACHRIEH